MDAARLLRWIVQHPWCLLVCWLVPAWLLPPVPIDETRYLTVAWEMRLSGDLVGLTLNGQPYMDKSPLLFWLIDASWGLFGVSTWAARLVDVAFAAGSVAFVGAVARRVAGEGAGSIAGWILAPFLLFGAFGSVIMFDTALCFFVLASLYALLAWCDGRNASGPLFLLVAMSLGLLAKGPVFLIHLLPPLVTVRWWYPRTWRRSWRFAVAVATLVVVAMSPLAWWALESAARLHGVPVSDTLVKQSLGRLADSYAHRRPFYWYLPLVPLVLLPWPAWLRWRHVPERAKAATASPLGRLGLAASVPAFVAFSVVSGKQVHYLLPLLPGIALFITAMLHGHEPLVSVRRTAVAIVAVALAWMWPLSSIAPTSPSVYLPVSAGVAALLVAWLILRASHSCGAHGRLVATSAISTFTAMSLVLLVGTQLKTHMDPIRLAHLVTGLRDSGVHVVATPDEPGMVGYLARFPRPLPVERDVDAWTRRHPDGVVLMHATHGPRPAPVEQGLDLVDGWEGLVPAPALNDAVR